MAKFGIKKDLRQALRNLLGKKNQQKTKLDNLLKKILNSFLKRQCGRKEVFFK